uniref:Reverse transcriptase domain-containing protein n=1 Tax=Tanacetum cinerariifolium TaxID=118510 RepID=A0A699I8K1_TANCI|nr:reverse transcriptase domain-containing protein [Tanacetum cinerariifolium]
MKNHTLIDHEYVNCHLRFDNHIRPANLLPIHMFDFDVILGMDWLASHRATIDCYARTVIFGNVRQPKFVYHGSSPLKSVKLISATKARTLISHGCQGFLASVMDTSLESPNIENLSVVREFAPLKSVKLISTMKARTLISHGCQDMALPPAIQRQLFLRYQGLEYSDADIADFKSRLAKIYRREIHRYREDQGQSVFTSKAWGRLFDIRGPLVHQLILEFYSTFRLIACSIVGRSQTPKKVIVTDLFYLTGMDVDSVNVPYLLGMTVITPTLPVTHIAKLVRLQIYVEIDDTWAWVAMGPERQPDVAADAPAVAEDAPAVDKSDQVVPASVHAPQQPPPPPPVAVRTIPQRLGRLEEDVQGQRRDVGSLHGLLERSMTDQGRFSTWMISCMAQLMDASGLTYQAFDGTFRGSSPLAF